jgi:hypothetical protein
MSLSERLEKVASSNRPGLPCRLGSLLQGDELPEKEKEYLKKILEVRLGEPARVPTTAITEALRQEGFEIGNAAVQRHRRKECRCFGASPKFSQG